MDTLKNCISKNISSSFFFFFEPIELPLHRLKFRSRIEDTKISFHCFDAVCMLLRRQ